MRVLSVVDALSFPESRKVVLSGDKKLLYEMLYSLGFDVFKSDLEYQICYHRPLVAPNKVVYTGRWVCRERDDEEWLNSGWASEEKKREMVFFKDPDLYKDLHEMSSYPNWSGRIEKYLKEWWG